MSATREALTLHFALLWAGFLCGLLAAYEALHLPMDFSSELRQAHTLGIVSLTTLGGYPKIRDILTYALLFTFPFFTAFGFWLWGTRREQKTLTQVFATEPADPPTPSHGRHRLGLFLLLTLFGVLSAFNINVLTMPGHNTAVSSWVTLGEEGQLLAWTQSLLRGGNFGKDFFCLYGPMLVNPIAWLMQLFGETMVVQRAYSIGLNFASIVLVLALLAGMVRSLPLYALSALFWLFIFSPLQYLSPNTTNLRVTLAFLPLYLVYRHSHSPAPSLLTWAGLALGQSLLFSQEAGLCALLASMVMLVAHGRARGQAIWADGTRLLITTLLSMAPLLLYLASQDALTATLASMSQYPKLVALGFGSIPFPSFTAFLRAPFDPNTFPYFAPILFYGFAALRIATRLWTLGPQPRLLLQGGMLLFGLLLFRAALGRSDLQHLNFVLPPAFMLLILFMDDALHSLRQSATTSGLQWLRAGELLLLVLAAIGYSSLNPGLRFAAGLAYVDLQAPLSKFQAVQSGVALPQLERGDTFFHPTLARPMAQIHRFLNANTKDDEPVYFFPNEAAYYFLFNRTNPSRYPMSFLAVTKTQRQELVLELETSQPRYVVYSLHTWRVDNIHESIQVPEVTAYLREKYRQVERFDGVTILERIQ